MANELEDQISSCGGRGTAQNMRTLSSEEGEIRLEMDDFMKLTG